MLQRLGTGTGRATGQMCFPLEEQMAIIQEKKRREVLKRVEEQKKELEMLERVKQE